MKEYYHVLGVMSGTSLDGIDIAEVTFRVTNGEWQYSLLEAETFEYSSFWKKRLSEAISLSEKEITQLDKDYTHYLSGVILQFIKKYSIKNLDVVCSHGHTIFHQPERGITLQIGNLPVLASSINQTVVCDFRVQDVQFGGQGAPLVPIGDKLLFSEYDYCLNLGGFANVSFEKLGKRIAFDVCPANIVLNYLCEKTGLRYDDKGEIARSGTVNKALLSQLNQISYYFEKPPKSLGLEWVKKEVFPLLNASDCSIKDKISTMTYHIATQIASVFEFPSKVLVSGGGTYNIFLLEEIKQQTISKLYVPDTILIEYKEALIFALLGVLKLRNEINCLSSVTGAKQDHSSGQIFCRTLNSQRIFNNSH